MELTVNAGEFAFRDMNPGDCIFYDEAREVLRFRGTGELDFNESEKDYVVQTFWKLCDVYGDVPSLTFALGPPGSAAPQTTLHRTGTATHENYTPNARSAEMWSAIAAAWPKQ